MTIFDDLYNILIKPVADALGNVLKPITDIINPEKAIATAKDSANTYEKTLGATQLTYTTKSPATPEDLNNQAWSQVTSIEAAYMAQATANIICEAASLGQIDVNVSELAHTPAIEAGKSTAIAIRRAEFAEGVYPALRRLHLKHFMPLLPETYRLALSVSRGILDQNKYYDAMSESGLSKEWADVWQEQNYVYPDMGASFELFWRGIIDDNMFTLIMKRNGFKDESIAQLKNLRDLIPPASDLITMVVREAFDPKMVTPAPDIFAQNMAKKGFSKEWSDRYWTAHWQPMGLGQAYSNLHWGYWSREDFMDFLRIADIHPIWREDIYNVAFMPPSIRELGYGYDVGAYTLDDIIKYRRRGGLTEEDANKAAAAMVAYRTEAERNAIRTEYMYLYSKNKISIENYEAKLGELSTNPSAIALWLERARAYKQRVAVETTPEEPPSMTRSTAQWLFENGVRPEEWLRTTLAGLGYINSTIDDFVAQSKFRIDQDKAKVAEIKYRKLTLTQIQNLFKIGEIDYTQLPDVIASIGYDTASAKRLADLMIYAVAEKLEPNKLTRTDIVRLYEYHLLSVSTTDMYTILNNIIKAEGPRSPTEALYNEFKILGYSDDDSVYLTVWTAIDISLPTLKTQYSKGWITAIDLYNSIRVIGIPDYKANEIMTTVVKATQPERTAPEKDLTKAEIIKGAKQGILSPSQASELLQGIGYDQNEALYLLYINAVVSRGDPEGYWEMRKVVEQQKKARGQAYNEIPDDLIRLELQIKDKKNEIERLKASKASEDALGEAAVQLANLETSMRVVIAKLKLA